jgi:hypothetical protein
VCKREQKASALTNLSLEQWRDAARTIERERRRKRALYSALKPPGIGKDRNVYYAASVYITQP